MRGFSEFGLLIAALLAGGPAFALGAVETNTAWPTPHQLEARNADDGRQPYAMTFSEEVARRPGVRDGRWEAFNTRPGDTAGPVFKGGFEAHGAVLRLQW